MSSAISSTAGRCSRTWYWDQTHNDVIQKLLRKARKGTRVIYIPGNHDENFRDFLNLRFGRVAVVNDYIHVTATGERYLVLHGDKFDGIVKYARWLALLGDTAYEWAMVVNLHLNNVRRFLKLALLVAVGLSQAAGSSGRWSSSRISRRR